MATFDYFGYRYEIIDEEKKEVKLLKFTTYSAPTGRVVVPHTVEYNEETYKVTAVGKNGFEIELSATFKIMEDGGFYKNTDISNGSYVLLTVWTLNMNGDVKIEFPAGLIPDNTDPRMANVHNYVDGQYVAYVFTDVESFGDTNKKSSSHVYRFFKTAEFAGSTDFTVTLIDNESQSEAEETLLG